MRKVLWLIVVAVLAFGVTAVAAQDKTPIEIGVWTEGELSNSAFEMKYSFSGTAGQLVVVEMLPKPGTYDLDPALVLRDSDGDVLGQSDDFSYPLSLVVAELPADEEYIILATRSGGSTGSSEGAYWVRVSEVELVEKGANLEATLTSKSEEAVPTVFVMRPPENSTYKIGLSQEIGELTAGLRVIQWDGSDYGGETVISIDETAKLSEATFTVHLDGGNFYVIIVREGFGFVFDEIEKTVNVTVN
jgi:hypothetical protein